MSDVSWTTVGIEGDTHVIPRLCPNCLSPSTQECRYPYFEPSILYTIGGMRHYHTFYYCDECLPVLFAGLKCDGLRGLLYDRRLIFFEMLFWALSIHWLFPDEMEAKSTAASLLVTGCILFSFGFAEVVARWYKGVCRRREPQQDFQAVWGAAAYYTGSKFKAARPEWIAALVEANAEQVDDTTYQLLVGRPKPDSSRPFA